MRILTIAQAEAEWDELIDAIISGVENEVVIMVDGIAAARIVPIESVGHSRPAESELRDERMFARAEAILDGHRNGFGMPILRSLALRKYGPAMLSLANRETGAGLRNELGRLQNPGSPVGLMYRAYRQRELPSAQNLAMTYFNVGDLWRYRHWMRRAAHLGDTETAREARLFEIRQSHRLARRLGRLRPTRRDGS